MRIFPDNDLPEPANYFPLNSVRFAVTPGFFPITTDFGNGGRDLRLFQIDREFARFRENAVAARTENVEKYVCFDPGFGTIASGVCRVIVDRLCTEYPLNFEWEPGPDGAGVLRCRMTNERLVFDLGMRLVPGKCSVAAVPPYQNAFDALMSQVPEDMAVVALPKDEPDKNVALHVTSPSHWSPEEKIGQSFLQTHAPVPHFDRIAAASAKLLESVRTRSGPVVRFNWGIEFTDRLNLHPEPPAGADPEEWNRRRVRPTDKGPIYLRIERQVLVGVPEVRALLFAIRVYVRPVMDLSDRERIALRDTLLTMPEESRVYKGLAAETFRDVVGRICDQTR